MCMILKKNNHSYFCKEGPHSALCDDEFYDAMETGLDKIDEDNQIKDRLKRKSIAISSTVVTPAASHKLWPEVTRFLVTLFVVLKT